MFLSILLLTLLQIPTFTIDTKLKNQNLVDHMSVLPDTAENLAFKDVLTMDNSFKTMKELPNILEMSEKSYWVKVILKNNTEYTDYVITTDEWDEVVVYNFTNGNWQSSKSGRLTLYREREIQYGRMINVPLKLQAQQKHIFYIHLSSTTAMGYSTAKTYQFLDLINLSSKDFIEKSGRISMIFYAIMIGISLALGFYNIIIFLFTRERSYLLLSLYLFGQVFYAVFDSGFSLEFLLPNNPEDNFQFSMYGILFTWLTLILFAQNYLRLKDFFPRYNKYLTILITVFIIFNLTSLFDIYKGFDGLNSILMLLLIFSLLFISIRTSLKGFKPAFFFLFADVFYIAGLFMVIVMNHYNMTLFEDFTIVNLPLSLGSILQALLLSFGTAYKVDSMRNELRKSQEEHSKLVEEQNDLLEKEVLKKTSELQVQNEELSQQAEELQAQRDQLEMVNREVSIQRNQIEKSIHSASLTQQAILPDHEVFNQYFKNKFILYHPKDIVSGDFYWSEKVDNKLFLAVVDCTGHGVPGAMMSLIGGALLSKAINEQKLSDPSEILSMLNKSIYENLKQDKNKGMEGMDLSICIFHLDGSKVVKLEFAGAKSDLYHQSRKGLEIHKGNRHSIGGSLSGKRFDTYTITLEKGDTIYLTTDGYLDQNDRLRKRYGKRSFENLIRDIDKFNMQDKAKMLKNTLSEHRGKEEQRDDITLLAFEV